MSQKVRSYIPQKSVLPYIAAGVSILAAVFTVINYIINKPYNPIEFIPLCLGWPVFGLLLFSVFSVLYSKKRLILMTIPVFIIGSYFLMLESGIIDYILGWKDYFRYIWTYSKLEMIIMVFRLLLIFALMVISLLTYAGVIRKNTPGIVICAINTVATLTNEIYHYIKLGEVVFFWKILSLLLVFIAVFISLSAIEVETEEVEE